jgi:putative Mg2+ transporter-C (MgtC) family protein
MVGGLFSINEIDFLIDMGLSLLAGFLIGAERESKGKPAGIGTHCFVIGGSMIFTYISSLVDPNSTSRIAAQIITGIGFLGAGIILKGEFDDRKESSKGINNFKNKKIVNLTTAASIWFSGAIGMTIGFNFYFISFVAIAFAVLVPRIPKVGKRREEDYD